jgi:hypothetical protein
MSYEKAMKHSIKKSRKQANNHFGFDTGSGVFKQSPEARKLTTQRMEVSRWFSERHDGDSQYIRKCIRESIAHVRVMEKNFFNKAA